MIIYCHFIFYMIYHLFIYLSHDLDNILLEDLGDLRTLQAVFELEALILTGIIFFCLPLVIYGYQGKIELIWS